jgi:4-hydroxy-tetrahydrodipicolinate synthase
MDTTWLRGTATALVTPFTPEGELDLKAMRRTARRQIDAGVRVLVPVGTTGESATTTAEEDQQIVNAVAEVGRRYGARVLAGIGSNNTSVAIANAARAREAGADAFLAVAPYYNKPTQDGLIAHYTAIAEAHPEVPVVLYNVPGRTASNLSAATTLRLAEIDNIVGVKEASGDLDQIMAILRERPDGFAVLSGDDALTLAMLLLGADGVVSVTSNVAPEHMVGMVDAALAGDLEQARTLHYRLLPLMNALFAEPNPAPAKAALELLGLITDGVRLPLVKATKPTRQLVADCLRELGALYQPNDN